MIRPCGELDLAGRDRLAATLQGADASAAVIVLDLSGLSFIDACGLRVLLEAKHALGDRLALLPGPPSVQRLFALTRTDHALGFAPGPTRMMFAPPQRTSATCASYGRRTARAAPRHSPTGCPDDRTGRRATGLGSERARRLLGAHRSPGARPELPRPDGRQQRVGVSRLARPAEGSGWSGHCICSKAGPSSVR